MRGCMVEEEQGNHHSRGADGEDVSTGDVWGACLVHGGLDLIDDVIPIQSQVGGGILLGITGWVTVQQHTSIAPLAIITISPTMHSFHWGNSTIVWIGKKKKNEEEEEERKKNLLDAFFN